MEERRLIDTRERTAEGLLVVPCCYGTLYYPPEVGCYCPTVENAERDLLMRLEERANRIIDDLEKLVLSLIPEEPAEVVPFKAVEPERFPLLRPRGDDAA